MGPTLGLRIRQRYQIPQTDLEDDTGICLDFYLLPIAQASRNSGRNNCTPPEPGQNLQSHIDVFSILPVFLATPT